MPRDYSEPAPLLRLLAAVVKGDRVSPPAVHEREIFLQFARDHRVERIAAWRIAGNGGDLEAWFGAEATRLREDERAAAVVDAVRNREIGTVLERIAAIDAARPLLLKGAALAHSHYPHSWLRPRLDTDILVSPERTASVFQALSTLGYQRTASTSGTLVVSQASFTRIDGFGIVHALDVHWKIANWQVIARVGSHGDLASRSVAVPALGAAARGLSDPDGLLLACLHRAAHHRDSEELLWLYDIHLLAERLTASDWTFLLEAAARGEVKTISRRGLALAMDYFASPVPSDVMAALGGARDEPSSIYVSRDLRLVDGLLSDLRALPWRHRVRLVAEHLFPPPEYIRSKYGLTSRRSLLLFYARRIVSGAPRWFATGGWS
ncbi:MAG TPA: nucleotidyltransferase family protein [Vicinamibacterales bacterium]|jgi:hypothetical protein